MKVAPRLSRFFWILGIVLLVGTVISVGLLRGSASPENSADRSVVAPLTHAGMCFGYVDSEHGISNLYPTQHGRIVEVREEGFHAKKGQWLLKIDNQQARLRVQEAKTQLLKAKRLPAQHKLNLKQQELAINEAKQQKKVAELDLDNKKTREQGSQGQTQYFKNEVKLAEETIKRLDYKIALEESKLDQLKLADPKEDVKRAQLLYEQALLGWQECQIPAPADGILLRSLVHVGEVLGANPKFPALQFAPDGKKVIRAEILQEWSNRFKVDQIVDIKDDTYAPRQWTGIIKRIGSWYAQKRSIILEPFTMNDVRSLECIVEINDRDESLCYGQRVRIELVHR